MLNSTLTLKGDRKINVRVDGRAGAPWLVFSNSLLTDLTIWDQQVSALADRFQILRYDQCGHGLSGVEQGPLDFSHYAADLLALLELHYIERFTFVGLSMGVPTGLAAFAKAPHRFERFVAVDGVAKSAAGREAFWSERRDFAHANGMEQLAEETAARWLTEGTQNSPQAALLKAMMAATPLEGYSAATHALSSYDFSSVLTTLNCPFLGIAGSEDGAMPDAVRNQFSSLPDARFSTINNAGHLPNFENPATFNKALITFLDETLPKTAKETA